MTGTPRNEDERAGRTHDLPVIDEHDVFAIEHVERLGAVVMHMKRGPKARWFFGFQYRHETPRVAFCGLHRHAEIAQVDEPSLAWTKHIRLRTLHGSGEVARSSEFRQHRLEHFSTHGFSAAPVFGNVPRSEIASGASGRYSQPIAVLVFE